MPLSLPLPLLLRVLRQPRSIASLSLGDWDLVVRQARQANVLASLDAMLRDLDLIEQVPPQPREHLEWAHAQAQRHRQAVHAEIAHIRKALKSLDMPVIFLKGAAYVAADLPSSAGRLFSDIDILVPKDRLPAVESLLMQHGWVTSHHDEYDQLYYRTWMHELPPMQHVRRMTCIDVHHAIVPETAPVHPDPAKLRAAAVAVGGDEGMRVLAPADMILHSAVHLFHDGEMDHGLRDLLDLDRLLRHFSSLPEFWPVLAARAQELELSRPLFYALRYADRLLGTPMPSGIMALVRAGQPNLVLRRLMDALFCRGLLPDHVSCRGLLSKPARAALYVRANWLRMPPGLLFRHLFHKAFLSAKAE